MFHKTFLSLSAVFAVGAVPAFAASHAEMDASKMTCGEFMAMDTEGMMAAATAVDMAMHDMAAGDMAADNMASDSMAADGMAADGMAADTGKMLMEGCAGHDDMMVMDVMHEG